MRLVRRLRVTTSSSRSGLTRDDGEAARAAELDLVALYFTSRLDWLGSVCVGAIESASSEHAKKVVFRLSCTVVVVQRQTDEHKILQSRNAHRIGRRERPASKRSLVQDHLNPIQYLLDEIILTEQPRA